MVNKIVKHGLGHCPDIIGFQIAINAVVPILDGNSEILCARKEHSLLFDLIKAYDLIENKDGFFSKKHLFSLMRAQHDLSYQLI